MEEGATKNTQHERDTVNKQNKLVPERDEVWLDFSAIMQN